MSVHSLIDKFSSQDEAVRPRGGPEKLPNAARETSGPIPGNYATHRRSGSMDVPPVSMQIPPVFQHQPPTPTAINREMHPQNWQMAMVTDPTHLSLLGPNIGPMNQTAFVEALRLRTEEERTRQELIRLQIAAKNLALAELAIKNDVPPHLIPSMCVGPQVAPTKITKADQPRRSELNKSPYLAPSPSLGRDQSDNASLVAPLNYRFGSGTRHMSAMRRPTSPAKLGAAAVANLANPITPYRPSHRTLPTHQRHFSMPAETLSPLKEAPDRKRVQVNIQQSPVGVTSSLQVRPLPAQPLRKHTKSQQVPTQESMSSFQHVIQFHHWRPDNLMERPENEQGERNSISSASLRRGLVSHKRHKSNDMSIDLLLVPQEAHTGPTQRESYMRRGPDQNSSSVDKAEDVSMDEVTLTEKQFVLSQQGRFPHDILLGSPD